jgi:hypothetical protein
MVALSSGRTGEYTVHHPTMNCPHERWDMTPPERPVASRATVVEKDVQEPGNLHVVYWE